MQNVMRHNLSANKMLSIFSSKGLNMPWRFQPRIQIEISLDEYVKFFKLTKSVSGDWIDTFNQISGVTSNEDFYELCRISLPREVAYVLADEVRQAQMRGREATIIKCTSNASSDLTYTINESNRVLRAIGTADGLRYARQKVLDIVTEEVYYSQDLIGHNRQLLDYATGLIALSFDSTIINNINFD